MRVRLKTKTFAGIFWFSKSTEVVSIPAVVADFIDFSTRFALIVIVAFGSIAVPM